MKVWLVSTGDYSDYHIIGAFSTKERAEHVQKIMRADNVEEYDCDEVGKDNRFRFVVHLYVDVEPNQTSVYVEHTSYEYDEINKVKLDDSRYTRKRYWVRVMAEDEQHAIKIASDLIAQYRALKE